MQERNFIKLLGPLLVFSGWWTACSTSGDPSQPADESSDIAAADEAATASTGEQEKVDAGDETSFEEDGEQVEETIALNPNGAEEDFIKDAADEETAADELAAAAAANSNANAVVDPTASSDPAPGTESPQNLDPTLLADNPSEGTSPPSNADISAEDLDADVAAAALQEQMVQANATSDVNPVGVGSDMAPPAFDGSPPANDQAVAQVPSPELANPAPAPVAEAETVSKVQNLDAALAQLRWVGYRIDEKDRRLKVEVITTGQPEFEIYEETNRAQQLELVIRFYQTNLRKKIRWSINSSEFRSPVALIRMREFQDQGVVDIVLTHRDNVVPEFVSKNGQMQLTYTLPDHYFDQSKAQAREIKERAASLVKTAALPLAPVSLVARGQSKQVGYPETGVFGLDPKVRGLPLNEIMRQQSLQKVDKEGLPASFERRSDAPSKKTGWKFERLSLMAVAQDDGDLDGGNADLSSESEEEVLSNEDAAAAAAETEALPVETVTQENASVVEEAVPAANSNQNAASSAVNTSTNFNANAVEPNAAAVAPINSASSPLEPAASNAAAAAEASQMPTDPEPAIAPAAAEAVAEAPADVVGQNSGEQRQQFTGKTIFMEFYDAPLSVVLKSFSEETGNNFVFPATIAQIPVTISFKGVPWDEALKAILETYSLGMVRIGQNVVRIDQISNLSNYLQALEQAHQFETRRLPTKVLVFRLNNALSKDVGDRINVLLARDIQLDARIRVTNDDRTNAIVVEAPSHVLAKAKNIIERLDLETPQVEIASRIVEVAKTSNNFFGVAWLNNFNFDPGRALGFGSLNFPNSLGSSFSVDPAVGSGTQVGQGRFRFGSLNKFVDLDLLLKMEERKGSSNVLQSNRVLVLDGQESMILSGSSRFFRPAPGSSVGVPGLPGTGGGGGGASGPASGLSEVQFNLSLRVTPQVTALGSVIMKLNIKSDTPSAATGEVLANKNTRELETQMVRANGDTGVIGGIYDTTRTVSVLGIPFLADIPIIGALFRSTEHTETQTELLIMVTPTIVSGLSKEAEAAEEATAASLHPSDPQALAPLKTDSFKF